LIDALGGGTRGLPVPRRFGALWRTGGTSDGVAALLGEAGRKFVSGERICRRLGLSRTAVWKAVRQLKSEGYRIEAARRSGYRVLETPDALLPRLVREGLRTQTVGSGIVCFRRATSTNDIGIYLAEHGCPDGLVVTAEVQSGGRGRLGRTWHSPAGTGLLFSVVLRPGLPLSGAQVLTFLGAVSAAKAIRALFRVPVALKWPNDLVLEGKKMGGVLTELSAESDLIRHAVIGIGINVNLPGREFPGPIRGTAVSVMEAAGRPVARVPLLRRILEEMDRRYAELGAGSGRLVDEWRALTPMIGRIVRVSHPSRVREGTVTGVDADGALLLRTPAGTVERLLAGDVTILRD